MPKKNSRKLALKVVFDTNALFTEAAHHLLRKEVKDVISTNSGHQDVAITWHLPEAVVHERTYQMQKRALQLLQHIERVEKLLDHRLAITSETLKDRVRKVVENQQKQHNITTLKLDTTKVDWNELCRRAAFREPPFEQEQEGKGFRDAMIIETLAQLVEDSPVSENICRIVFISDDSLIGQATTERLKDRKNVRVLKNSEELKGLINTIVSEVPEEFVAELATAANAFFFDSKGEATSFYNDMVEKRIEKDFRTILQDAPRDATNVNIEEVSVDFPNFVRKVRQTIHWSTMVHYQLKATKDVPKTPVATPTVTSVDSFSRLMRALTSSGATSGLMTTSDTPSSTNPPLLGVAPGFRVGIPSLLDSAPSIQKVTVGESRASFEVSWSTKLSLSKKLRTPKVDDVRVAISPWAPSGS